MQISYVLMPGILGGKCSQQVELSGENINLAFKPDGTHLAVGNKVGKVEELLFNGFLSMMSFRCLG